MSGMCSTECGCLMIVMGEDMTPGLEAGWSKEQMTQNYQQMATAMGQDAAEVPRFIDELEKIYSAGRNMVGKFEYSRLHALYNADVVSSVYF